MTLRFVAEPPLRIALRELRQHLWRLLRNLFCIVWQILVPFRSQPENVDPLPEPATEIADEHIEQCRWIFDQAGKRRAYLEQKAQSTFGLVTFLVPLLASLFVFIISRPAASGIVIRPTINLLIVSAVLLLVGFVSAVRAVAVKTVHTLYVHSVVDESGQFRANSNAFRARGLLWCAAMNEAMNDHVAQFVKGAHILTAGAILTLLVAAAWTSATILSLPSTPTQIKIERPVAVYFREVSAFREDVVNLRKDIENLSNTKASDDGLKRLEEQIATLKARLNKLQKPRMGKN